MRIRFLIVFFALLTALSLAQDSSDKAASNKDAAEKSPPQGASADKSSSDKNTVHGSDAEESSSHDTRVDLSPPKDDEKDHPNSKTAVADLEPRDIPDNGGIEEFHPWNPLKAIKDIEVGDFYFKRKSYKAALDRYKEALYYKDGDAVANFRVAECQEKLGNKTEARNYYEQYLKVLPEGPLAKEAHAALDRLPKEP